jgi:hypothetical protein
MPPAGQAAIKPKNYVKPYATSVEKNDETVLFRFINHRVVFGLPSGPGKDYG